MKDADELLVKRMLEGEESAFTELYRAHQANIYRFALHMSGSKTTAEDVTQEVFLTLIQRGGEYDSRRGPVVGFLFGIARNQVLRWLRSRKNSMEVQHAINELPAQQNPLQDLARKENIDSIRRLILGLPPKYREAVVLCDLNEMDYESISRVVGCSIGTVRSRLHRGRAMLEAKLRGGSKPVKDSQGGRSYEIAAH